MSRLCAWASAMMRRLTSAMWAVTPWSPGTCSPSKWTPIRLAAVKRSMKSAVAMSALLGTQSVSTAAPPRPERSTRVTSAPSCVAARAAS